MATLKFPFALEKPSESVWVTDGDQIGYDEETSVKDKIDSLNQGLNDKIDSLNQDIIDDERVISTSLNDLNSRVIDNKEIISDLQGKLTNKQDKLTAGNNITIVNNVISATGGSGEGNVNDVKVNGDSVVTDKVANITLNGDTVKVGSATLSSALNDLNTDISNLMADKLNVHNQNTNVYFQENLVTNDFEIKRDFGTDEKGQDIYTGIVMDENKNIFIASTGGYISCNAPGGVSVTGDTSFFGESFTFADSNGENAKQVTYTIDSKHNKLTVASNLNINLDTNSNNISLNGNNISLTANGNLIYMGSDRIEISANDNVYPLNLLGKSVSLTTSGENGNFEIKTPNVNITHPFVNENSTITLNGVQVATVDSTITLNGVQVATVDDIKRLPILDCITDDVTVKETSAVNITGIVWLQTKQTFAAMYKNDATTTYYCNWRGGEWPDPTEYSQSSEPTQYGWDKPKQYKEYYLKEGWTSYVSNDGITLSVAFNGHNADANRDGLMSKEDKIALIDLSVQIDTICIYGNIYIDSDSGSEKVVSASDGDYFYIACDVQGPGGFPSRKIIYQKCFSELDTPYFYYAFDNDELTDESIVAVFLGFFQNETGDYLTDNIKSELENFGKGIHKLNAHCKTT